jgi:hypothetical protein
MGDAIVLFRAVDRVSGLWEHGQRTRPVRSGSHKTIPPPAGEGIFIWSGGPPIGELRLVSLLRFAIATRTTGPV